MPPVSVSYIYLGVVMANALLNWVSIQKMRPFKLFPQFAPNSWTSVNLITSVAGIIFLIHGGYLRLHV